MSGLTESPAWQALISQQREMAGVHMRDLFARDPQRFERFSLQLSDVLLDYSKNRITEETMTLLMDLARQANLAERIEAMFNGDRINTTQDRAVLHVALRNRSNRPILMGAAAGHTIAFSKGSIYLARNGNLLYHGRIAMNEDGTFKPFHVDGETY
jgi:nitrogen fixation/metabolism regulation signal transduction histidine kinase